MIKLWWFKLKWWIDDYLWNLRHRKYEKDGGTDKLEYIYGFYKDARNDMRVWRFVAIIGWVAAILLLLL